jgi:periplasmic nitrate reductase NapD
MSGPSKITRRSLLKVGHPSQHHISSAVVVAFPERREELARRLSSVPGVEVHAGEGSRIVVTIEGPSSGMLGETLTRISAMDGVISANMVFEHIDQGKDPAT